MEEAEELRELRSEVARHHRDFDKISEICDRALQSPNPSILSPAVRFEAALRRIRNIVG